MVPHHDDFFLSAYLPHSLHLLFVLFPDWRKMESICFLASSVALRTESVIWIPAAEQQHLLMRSAESQAPSYDYWITISILTRSLAICTHVSLGRPDLYRSAPLVPVPLVFLVLASKPLYLLFSLPGTLSLTYSLTYTKASLKCHLSVRPYLTTLCQAATISTPSSPIYPGLIFSITYHYLLAFLTFLKNHLSSHYKTNWDRVFHLLSNFSWIPNA